MNGTYRFEIAEKLVETHRDELIREAEQYRLAHSTEVPRRSFWEKPTWNMGAVMIAAGSWLQTKAGIGSVEKPCTGQEAL